MLGSAKIDELIVAIEKLLSQISAQNLAPALGASICGAAEVDCSEGIRLPVENRDRVFPDDPGNRNDRLKRTATPTLPDPRLIRRIIRQRQQRYRFFKSELFHDPVWDMLLDLAAATSEYRQVSVTSLCIASRVPPSTALRWIGLMTEQGLLRRVEDPLDRRRVYISLSDDAMNSMARYFESLGADAKVLA